MKSFNHSIIVIICIVTLHFSLRAADQGYMYTSFTDQTRNRVVNCIIYYPSSGTGLDKPLFEDGFDYRMGVMVFGHGYQTPMDAYRLYVDSYIPMNTPPSYVLIAPLTEMDLFPSAQDFAMDMVACLKFMQDEGVRPGSRFYNRIENSNVIVGHSMGGGAAILAAEYALRNTALNIVKLIAIAPVETNPSLLSVAKNVTCQTMIIVGDKDCVSPLSIVSRPLYDSLGATCKTLVIVTGGSHCQFADSNAQCSALEVACTPGRTRADQLFVCNHYINYFLFPSIYADYTAPYSNCTVMSTLRTIRSSDLIASKTLACEGDTITVRTTKPLLSYLWLPDGVTTPTYTFVVTKTTKVILSENLCLPEITASLTIIVGEPRRNRINGNNIVCEGDSTMLTIDTVSFNQCKWSTGETSSRITVRKSGTYSVRSFDPVACAYTTDSVNVSVNGPTKVAFRLYSGGTYFCQGAGVVIGVQAPSDGSPDFANPDWVWTWSSGSHGYILSFAADTTVTIWVVGQNRLSSCKFYSDTVSFAFHSIPNPKPAIERHVNLLISSLADAYNWRLNNAIIPGQSDRMFAPSKAGKYSVITQYFSDEDTCSNISDAIDFDFQSDVQEQPLSEIIISQTDGVIKVRGLHAGDALSVCDFLGRKLCDTISESSE